MACRSPGPIKKGGCSAPDTAADPEYHPRWIWHSARKKRICRKILANLKSENTTARLMNTDDQPHRK